MSVLKSLSALIMALTLYCRISGLLDFGRLLAVGTKEFRLPQTGREARPRWHFLFSCFHFFRGWHCLGQGHLVARPASVGSLTFSFVNEWSSKTAVSILILWISSVTD